MKQQEQQEQQHTYVCCYIWLIYLSQNVPRQKPSMFPNYMLFQNPKIEIFSK